MLVELIERYADQFGVEAIENREAVNACVRTGFSWSVHRNTICLAAKDRFLRQAAENPNVRAMVLSADARPSLAASSKGMVVCKLPDELFYEIHNLALHEQMGLDTRWPSRIDPSARIHPSAVIPGHNVEIGPDVEIGPLCAIFENTWIGRSTQIIGGCLVGVPGLFAKKVSGRQRLVRHFGGVRIGSNCVLYGGVNICRSAIFGDTTGIGEEVHLSQHSIIGHDAQIGEQTRVGPNVVISGRTMVGRNCWFGISAAVSNGLNVGDGARVNLGAVVIHDVPAGAVVSGNFALDHRRNIAEFRQRAAEYALGGAPSVAPGPQSPETEAGHS